LEGAITEQLAIVQSNTRSRDADSAAEVAGTPVLKYQTREPQLAVNHARYVHAPSGTRGVDRDASCTVATLDRDRLANDAHLLGIEAGCDPNSVAVLCIVDCCLNRLKLRWDK
jgi:hypothetical protein